MNISDWFIREEFPRQNGTSGFFIPRCEDSESGRDWKENDLILIMSDTDVSSSFYRSLSSLHNHFPFQKIFFAGKVKDNNPDYAMEALQSCIQQDTTSFFLGGNKNMAAALADTHGLRVTYISNALPLAEEIKDGYNYIGFQRHLCEYKALKYVEEFCPDSLSLGQMKSNGHLLEPLLRDTEVLYVNLNVIRSAELPGCETSWPSGLNTEEICQIAKIAGSSGRLKTVILDFAGLQESPAQCETKLMAEFFWYLLEGITCKQHDHPAVNTNISEYVVNMADFDTELIFVKSNITQRWWLRIQDNESFPYLSCAQEEYQLSIQNEIPERLLRHIL